MTINEKIQWIIDTQFRGSKTAFANKISISTSTVDGIVGERKSSPSYKVLRKISSIMGYSGDWLLDEENSINLEQCKKIGNIQIGRDNLKLNCHEENSLSKDLIEALSSQIKILSEQINIKDEQIKSLLSLLSSK